MKVNKMYVRDENGNLVESKVIHGKDAFEQYESVGGMLDKEKFYKKLSKLADTDDIADAKEELEDKIAQQSEEIATKTVLKSELFGGGSPNVYDKTKNANGSLSSNGNIQATAESYVSDYILIPRGMKAVATRGDSRQADTYRTKWNFGRAFLFSLSKDIDLLSVVSGVNEIQNTSDSDMYFRFSFSVANTNAYGINRMVELMDIDKDSNTAIGFTEYYEYSETVGNVIKSECIPLLESTMIESRLKDKKIIFFGDSFTYDSNGNSARYHTFIKNRCGSVHYVHGLTGSNIIYKVDSSVASMSSDTRLSEITEDCDMICIFGGINDSRNTVTSANTYKIGDIDDVWDSESNTNTLYASLKHIVEYLIDKYPTKKIVALLPPCLNPNADSFTNYNAVAEAEKEVYKKYGIPYLDLRAYSTISTTDKHIELYNMGIDNVHWNNEGHERASHPIQRFLEQYI